MAKYIFIIVLLFASTSVSAQKHLRLLSYNIRNAKGMDNKTDADRIAAVIRNTRADVIALQEVDSVTKRSGGTDLLKILSEKAGLHHIYGAAIPFQGGKYGVGILCRKKPVKYYTVPLPGKEEQRVLLVAEFRRYVVFCTHLSLTPADRITSVSIINNEVKKFSKPVYLLGDMNAEPDSEAIAALKTTWRLLSSESTPTFPAGEPVKCIDYIFGFNTDPKRSFISTVIVDAVASDHRPVFAETR